MLIISLSALYRVLGSTISLQHIIAMLLEQDLAIGSEKKISLLMYILLMFVAFIVSNGYKEFLFTFMTTVTLPSVPKNVNQLTSSALPIVTTSYRKQVKNEIRESVVLARIVNIIENTGHSTDHGDVFKVLASASDLTIRKKRNGRCTCNFYFRERLKTIENC